MNSGTGAAVAIDAAGLHYRELNERVRSTLDDGATEVRLLNVCGHRYIGAGLESGARIVIEGVPGNDLACFMDGPSVEVRGNTQDGVANTMSSGTVVIHGDAGDVLAYAMRGGRLFVRGDAGYRTGIHMKEYRDRVPVVIVGGTAKDYFGEYMAGGTLVLLGLERPNGTPLAGDFVGTGMHGGQILLRGPVEDWQLGKEVGKVELSDAAWFELKRNLGDFAREFELDPGQFRCEDFTRLMPVSHRPYGKVYVY
jgi:glutamate synthase domain-containing protein 3